MDVQLVRLIPCGTEMPMGVNVSRVQQFHSLGHLVVICEDTKVELLLRELETWTSLHLFQVREPSGLLNGFVELFIQLFMHTNHEPTEHGLVV